MTVAHVVGLLIWREWKVATLTSLLDCPTASESYEAFWVWMTLTLVASGFFVNKASCAWIVDIVSNSCTLPSSSVLPYLIGIGNYLMSSHLEAYMLHLAHKCSSLLAQRPITLVLMMNNLCSYSTNDLVLFKFQIFNQDVSWCLALTKNSKSSFEVSRCWFKSSRIKIALSTQEESSSLDQDLDQVKKEK